MPSRWATSTHSPPPQKLAARKAGCSACPTSSGDMCSNAFSIKSLLWLKWLMVSHFSHSKPSAAVIRGNAPLRPRRINRIVFLNVYISRYRTSSSRMSISSANQAQRAVTSHAAAWTQIPSGRRRTSYCSSMAASTCAVSTGSRLAARVRITGMPQM
jgi:hypothetical protein